MWGGASLWFWSAFPGCSAMWGPSCPFGDSSFSHLRPKNNWSVFCSYSFMFSRRVSRILLWMHFWFIHLTMCISNSFIFLVSSIPLHGYTIVYSLDQLKRFWVVSSFWQLCINIFLFHLGILGMRSLSHVVRVYVTS